MGSIPFTSWFDSNANKIDKCENRFRRSESKIGTNEKNWQMELDLNSIWQRCKYIWRKVEDRFGYIGSKFGKWNDVLQNKIMIRRDKDIKDI